MNFEQLRVNGRINISEGIKNNLIIVDEEETIGARNKFWFNNYEYLFKEIYNNTYEDYAELIASELASFLNISCASYDLALFNGKKGVITKNFVNEDAGFELISGTEVINEVYQKYICPLKAICKTYKEIVCRNKEPKIILKELMKLYKNSLINSKVLEEINIKDIDNFDDSLLNYYLEEFKIIMDELNEMYEENFTEMSNGIIKANNLFDLWAVVDIYCKLNNYNHENSNIIIKKLVNLFLYDIITSQGDRHSDNWGLIVNQQMKFISLSPIYDNSNLCNLNRSKAFDTIVSYIESLKSSNIHIKKKENIEKRLKASINHERSSLKVEPEDISLKNNNIVMINEFINESSREINEEILNIINKLTEENINKIYKKIENKIKVMIPDKVKLVVSETIKLNIEEIRKVLKMNKEESYGK